MTDDQLKSGLARRIGSTNEVAPLLPNGQLKRVSLNALLLHCLAAFLLLPALVNLASSDFWRSIGCLIGFVGLLGAARLMRRGLHNAHEFDLRLVAKTPPLLKTVAHLLTGLSTFILALLGAGETVAMSGLFGLLAGIGAYFTYGGDRRDQKNVDAGLAARAGIDTATVIDALNEASAKLTSIETDASGIHSRELTDRLRRIVVSGRRILEQIERDPSDIRQARRFLVTYLEGTQDVVGKYRRQQKDIADTPLGENFRHVLETVERVFNEQELVLKRNQTLDLEVQIDVLKTQMEREGVV